MNASRLGRHLLTAWLLALGVHFTTLAPAAERTLDARSLFALGMTRHLALTPGSDAIQLRRGVVIEDDGPAAGYSYQPNAEQLKPDLWIKKELLVPSPRARRAVLLVGQGGELTARLNGKPLPLEPLGKQGNYWQAWRFPPHALRPGSNKFVLSGNGSVWIARDDEYAAGSLTRTSHPNRSAKSTDGGKTWNDRQLGTQNNIDGEYYVRLFLDQFSTSGELTLGVLDTGNLGDQPIGPPVSRIGPVQIQLDAVTPAATSIAIHVRSGTSQVPADDFWSDWSRLSADGVLKNPRGRYLQVKLRFSTEDVLQTPGLKSLTVNASPQRPADWTDDVRVAKFDNQRIVRSSIPFSYEPFDRPELETLRERYQLDEVVEGAETEFELMRRLAAWSATRWRKMHLGESYPPYNALEILKPHRDGTPVGGFCQQYNLVFLQACQSFGLVGRLVSIGPGNRTDWVRGGHEVAEIWSNEFRKWIYIDGNAAWYAVDRETRVPLSLRELRERQVAALAGRNFRPVEVIVLEPTKYSWPDLKHWPPLLELRLIPRNNFLEQSAPLPLNQGMRGWFWTGHFTWSDDLVADRLLYPNRTVRPGNFEWTLNQAELAVEAAPQSGRLRVHVDTQTPGFETFVLNVDGKTTEHARNIFLWELQPGKNRLSVTPRNQAGRLGISSVVELIYSGEKQ